MAKMQPCCARRAAKLTMDKSALARLARKASATPENPRWPAQIAKAKAAVELAKAQIADHEAEHAGEAAA